MRYLSVPMLLALLVCGCADSAAPTAIDDEPMLAVGERWVSSRSFRRTVLEDALVTSENLYSRTRLEHFAVEGAASWDELPVRRPVSRPLTLADLGTFDATGRRRSRGAGRSGWAPDAWTHEGLMRLGERAFFEFPMRADARLAAAGSDRETVSAAGLWIDDEGRVGGLVTEVSEDSEQIAWTCAMCHASVDEPGGEAIPGLANAAVDVDSLFDAARIDYPRSDAWRPGMSDPTDDGVTNPSVIPDLRPIRLQSHLHWTATVRNSLAALTMRVETLLIVSQGQRSRPPRELAFALAYYLWNLGREPAPLAGEGGEIFEARCASCHRPDGRVEGPLPLADDGRYPGRGTGTVRIPSLAGVGDRSLLMHDGSAASLEELLNDWPSSHPERPRLEPDEVAALVRALRSH